MSAYTDARRRTAEKMGNRPDGACMVCGNAASNATLSDFGARCFPCYQAYCREPSYDRGRSRAAERIRAEIAAMGRKG